MNNSYVKTKDNLASLKLNQMDIHLDETIDCEFQTSINKEQILDFTTLRFIEQMRLLNHGERYSKILRLQMQS